MAEETNGVFICYRHEGAAGHAGRLKDSLSNHFGKRRVFRDIDSIGLGLEFPKAIQRAIGSSEVLIAVIDKNWVTATDAAGHKRLEDANDYVRMEIAAALKRNIRVVPLLVQGASMPSADELPDELKPLTLRHAYPLNDFGWEQGVQDFITRLDEEVGQATALQAPNYERPETHLPFPERLQYIGPDQNQLLARIPRDSEISQDQLEDEAGYPSNELYWRLEQLCLMGLVDKRETHRVGNFPRYEYRLSPQYTRYLETGEQNSQSNL